MKPTKWWQNTAVYQIYPKSFNDTTGSGTGDLRGITEKLDYLKDLGAGALWLTPVYPSPMVDNGYDISDYTGINPDFGTLADMEELIAEAKARSIRIVTAVNFSTEEAALPAGFLKGVQLIGSYADAPKTALRPLEAVVYEEEVR